MAKAIKFNLILDNKPVRSLDDLRDNFNIEDLLGAYRNGSLKRWLESRESAKEIAELEKVSGDDINAARELCRIFQGDCSKQQIETAVYPFEFRQKEAEKLRQFKNLKEEKDTVIKAYHDGYTELLDKMEGKGQDYPFLKAAVQEIFEKYAGLYRLNAEDYYKRFIQPCPLVILSQIANPNMRPLLPVDLQEVFSVLNIAVLTMQKYKKSGIERFLEKWKQDPIQPNVRVCEYYDDNQAIKNNGKPILMLSCDNNHTLDEQIVSDMDQLKSYYPFTYIYISDIPESDSAPAHVKIFAGVTEGYWKDVQPKGKRFLLIKMEQNNFVRNSGKNGEELKAEDVNGKFLILDGIDYKSNNAAHQLVYMEV
ncbi:hypothetical protein ACYULU_00475 [Breznakiellaceae bacterium SP9]